MVNYIYLTIKSDFTFTGQGMDDGMEEVKKGDYPGLIVL